MTVGVGNKCRLGYISVSFVSSATLFMQTKNKNTCGRSVGFEFSRADVVRDRKNGILSD